MVRSAPHPTRLQRGPRAPETRPLLQAPRNNTTLLTPSEIAAESRGQWRLSGNETHHDIAAIPARIPAASAAGIATLPTVPTGSSRITSRADSSRVARS